MVEARAWGSEILDDFGTFETLYNLQSAIVREYVCFSLRVYIMGHCADAKEKARGLVRLTGAYRIPQNGNVLEEKWWSTNHWKFGVPRPMGTPFLNP